MSRITSKLQVTIPKAIAERHRLRPGDEIEWVSAGDAIRVETASSRKPLSLEARLKMFDESTARQRRRQAGRPKRKPPRDRGWTREDLYERARPR